MTDAYHHIYTGEIFQKSQCIWHENVMLDWLRSNLMALGYVSAGGSNKVWHRDSRTVIVCLVDDISTCSNQADPYVPRLWDSSVTVLTDNHVTCPTLYTVKQMPTSWFGIYFHDGAEHTWQPDRRFNFGVNRLDMKRMLLFLEYRKRLPWQPDRDVMDYVNFNCWAWDGDNTTAEGQRQNFQKQWQLMDDLQKIAYQDTFDQDLDSMPFRNHDLAHDSAMQRAWINLVVETYSGDSIVALSEKIFRALVTPAPWMVYSGRYTVVYLESLGFDCLTDVIDHTYDAMIETRTVDYGDKLVDWFWKANESYQRLRSQDFTQLSARCQQAAQHNRKLLHQLRNQWPQQLASWWWSVSNDI
jgi:hypothetical protein